MKNGDWGLGIGDWGLGGWGWGLRAGCRDANPKPPSPNTTTPPTPTTPNPQSPTNYFFIIIRNLINICIKIIK